MKHTHSGRLERYLGVDEVERISQAMQPWYGGGIPVAGVPGNVFAMGGGDFVGEIRGGWEATMLDRARSGARRFARAYARACRRRGQLNLGFTSLSDLINEVTVNGKRQDIIFYKLGTTGVANAASSLWRVGSQPSAGGAPSAAPGGSALTSATAGAMMFTNPAGGDSTHLTTGHPTTSVLQNTLLLYDRLFAVVKTMSSNATEAVTGVPTRYQSTTAADPDYAGNNFVFPDCAATLGATAHNWTVCQYTDQGGNAAQSIPSIAGNSSNVINRIDLPAGQWFMPLAAGDNGIKALTQMQCSASVTGSIDFVIGHPIAVFPLPLAQMDAVYDGVNSAFGLARIFDSACLAFMEWPKPSTTATSYTGMLSLASG